MKWGTRYGSVYVNVLRRGVEENLNRKHRFICLTDDPRGIMEDVETFPISMEGIPEEQIRRGGWPKLKIFEAPLRNLSGPTLFLDLDVIITGPLDSFFEHLPEKELMIIRDWLPRFQALYRSRGWIGNSSVFRFKVGEQVQILERFLADPDAAFSEFRNEQRFLTKHAKDIGYWPDEWCRSFKRHCMKRKLSTMKRTSLIPSEARVIVFHGNPKPDDLAESANTGSGYREKVKEVDWVSEYWLRHSEKGR